MITYKVVERRDNEYLPIYYREDIIYKLDESAITFDKVGIHSYVELNDAKEELCALVHTIVAYIHSFTERSEVVGQVGHASLLSKGGNESPSFSISKDYCILLCKIPDEAIIKADGNIVTSKIITPIKELILT